eukprot:545501-Karenia_brevis.AAC.1
MVAEPAGGSAQPTDPAGSQMDANTVQQLMAEVSTMKSEVQKALAGTQGIIEQKFLEQDCTMQDIKMR